MRLMTAVAFLGCLGLTAASAAVETFVISNEGWTNAELAYMEPGRLVLKAEGLDERNRPELVLGVSTDLGQTWKIQRMPMLNEGRGWPIHCLAYAGLYWGYSGVGLNTLSVKEMPIYYSDDGATWGGSTVTATDPGASKRVVNGVQMGHVQARLMWAGGYEETGGGLQGRLWRSTDSGMYWEPVPIPGETPRDVSVGGRAPDFTVYGWTRDKVLRLNPDRSVTVLPGFKDMWYCYGMCAPSNNRVVACWCGGWRQPLNYYLSYSDDRGATWDHRSTGLTGSPFIAAVGDLLLASTQSPDPLLFDGWYMHLSKGSNGDIVWSEALSGQRVLGIALVPPGHAFALVVKSDPRYLYCVRRLATTAVANRPPTAPTVRLKPRHPKPSDDIVCTASGSTDPDGDQVTYRYQWYKNDVLQQGLTQSTLASRYTKVGERWKCVVTPSDGKVDGPSAYSSVRVEP